MLPEDTYAAGEDEDEDGEEGEGTREGEETK
jgi:hypothetical protein